ncbi:MAG: carboxypeptidase-like regulatory domain-containing protein [Cytophagales bacterium]|nr:MAG: carboxypeptidase-like regulatory domain-containing protein [Cytophagales bacterium]
MQSPLRSCFLLWFCLLALVPLWVRGQTIFTISGRVTESATNAGIPFASISVKGRTAGATADAEGRFQLRTTQIGDSLLVTSLGFKTKAVALTRATSQTVDAALESADNRLKEVRVYGKGGDPAYRVLRAALPRRAEFNPEQLTAFQYDSYTKVEAYINNVKKKPRVKRNGETVQGRQGPIGRVLSRLPAITDENGQPAVPVFITENHSEYYQRNQPDRTKEKVLKSQVKAVGIQEGGLLSQFTGASFQQYNFYQNYVRVLRKDIPSPLGDVWETVYKVQMIDTVAVGNLMCYQIDFEPKRATDLAFMGTAWLDTMRLGLVQIETRIDRRANINFIEEIRVNQEWETLPGGARLPLRTEVRIDTDELTPGTPGALIRFFATARNVVINQPQPLEFYSPTLELADDYRDIPKGYWQTARPDSLSADEMRALRVVDSVRNVPIVKITGEAIRLFANGYQPIGKVNVDVGPLLYTYANNNIEGNRFRVGVRTNSYFSRRWVLNGYLAYGTRDTQLKYGIGADFIVKRKPWTVVGFRHTYDIERLGVSSENIGSNYLFLAFSRFGTIRRPYTQELTTAYIRHELGKGFTQTVSLRNRSFNPLYPFGFYESAGNQSNDQIRSRFRASELSFETRFAPDEVIVQSDNERLSFGTTRKPEITFRYTLGIRDGTNTVYPYHRLTAEMKHSFRLGIWGRTSYTLGAGVIPSAVPYPLLFIPLGNETSFWVYNAYNLMNFFEFATDRYASAHVEHNFEGLFFNRIPAIRRLKWRTLVTGRIMYGGIRADNLNLSAPTDALGQPVAGFQSLNRVPYIEVGYGIDNIFKFIRVDATHRLTYRDNPGVTPFAVKFSAWVGL